MTQLLVLLEAVELAALAVLFVWVVRHARQHARSRQAWEQAVAKRRVAEEQVVRALQERAQAEQQARAEQAASSRILVPNRAARRRPSS